MKHSSYIQFSFSLECYSDGQRYWPGCNWGDGVIGPWTYVVIFRLNIHWERQRQHQHSLLFRLEALQSTKSQSKQTEDESSGQIFMQVLLINILICCLSEFLITRRILLPKRLNEELSSNIAIKVGGGEFSQRGLQTSSSRMVETEVQFDKPEPDTFMTQKRHPVHHFINFVKFSTFGASLIYLGNQIMQKIKETTE